MSTALAERKAQITTLGSLLKAQRPELEKALTRSLDVDRFIVSVTTAVKTNPGLLECTPLSIVACAQQAAIYQLEMGSVLGQCYMVPYYNKHTRSKEAQFQIGYRGLQALAFRSGKVSSFPAHVVRERDTFDYELGTHPYIRHKPTGAPDPGPVTHVYAVIHVRDGQSDFEVMTREQIEAHRQRYSKDTRPDSAWNTAWEEQAKKTVIRRLAKRTPVSIEFQEAALKDEYGEAGVHQDLPAAANTIATTQARLDVMKERIGASPTREQQDALAEHLQGLQWTDQQVGYFLEAWNVSSITDLSTEQADEAIVQLKVQLREVEALHGSAGAREPGQDG